MRKKSVELNPIVRIKALEQEIEDIKQRLEMLEPKETNLNEWHGIEY